MKILESGPGFPLLPESTRKKRHPWTDFFKKSARPYGCGLEKPEMQDQTW